jgi:hypothetical protein
MNEAGVFLADLALVAAAGLLALADGASASGRLAAGLYGLAMGATLLLVPALTWEVARTDNAFLGLYFIALLAAGFGVLLAARAAFRRRARPDLRGLVTAVAAAVFASGLALLLLRVRGPGAWRTGSGEFGLDVILADVALGAAAYLLASRLARESWRGVD